MVETSRFDWRRSLVGEHDIGVPVLLFAFLGSALAWAVHFNLIYFLVALFCTTGWRGGAAAVGIATVVFFAISVAAGVVAYRQWRAHARGTRSWDTALAETSGRVSFLLLIGMISAMLFTLLILFEGVPIFFVPTCPEFVE